MIACSINAYKGYGTVFLLTGTAHRLARLSATTNSCLARLPPLRFIYRRRIAAQTPTDADFSVHQPDRWHLALRRGLDFVGELNRCRYNVVGKVWAETKAYTAADFDGKVAKAKETIEKDFSVLQRKDTTFGAAMLLVAKIGRSAGAAWDAPKLFAELYVDDTWLDIGPLSGRPASTGRLLAARTQRSLLFGGNRRNSA